ncbi:Leukotoxin [Roseivivax jejudonensis]|uniref:Leukotoxin n=1 Tax=Roseivivax jejudonensis TaxID=1529041 RepID=A0A1X6ZPN3_9RHOB|nr:SGNH/GDSL hydrolase family protein [Roseivivax jejudonensis]SLN57513.1 Leukotoxin [Roseivivax jejudonensis]
MPQPDFDRLVLFGDSLTDAGEIFRLTSEVLAIPFPLESAGYAGVLSNGPVYSQTLPDLLGVDSEVFAVASAQAVGERPLWQVLGLDDPNPPFDGALVAPLILPDTTADDLSFDVNLGAQVDRFLAEPIEGDTAASFLIGLNDVSRLDLEDPGALFDAITLLNNVVESTRAAAQAVVDSGAADTVILYSFPNAAFLPGAADLDPVAVAALDVFVGLHEVALRDLASDLEDDGADAMVVDLNALTAEIDADMAAFGLEAKGPVLLGTGTDPQIILPADPGDLPTLFFPEDPAVAGLDPAQVQFFDFLHPTTAVHDVFAVYSAAAITRETHVLSEFTSIRLFDGDDHLILARGGSDFITLGGGDDIALGGTGNDTVFGNGDEDLILGGSGRDDVRGGTGDDLLAGGPGRDRLTGGSDDDTMIGGTGDDRVDGRSGDDVFVWAPGDGDDTIIGGSGNDTLYLAESAETAAALADAESGRSFWEAFFGTWDLGDLGLSVSGIEKVRLFASLEEIPGGSDGALADADLWGVV